jgi:hypothetical protein
MVERPFRLRARPYRRAQEQADEPLALPDTAEAMAALPWADLKRLAVIPRAIVGRIGRRCASLACPHHPRAMHSSEGPGWRYPPLLSLTRTRAHARLDRTGRRVPIARCRDDGLVAVVRARPATRPTPAYGNRMQRSGLSTRRKPNCTFIVEGRSADVLPHRLPVTSAAAAGTELAW